MQASALYFFIPTSEVHRKRGFQNTKVRTALRLDFSKERKPKKIKEVQMKQITALLEWRDACLSP